MPIRPTLKDSVIGSAEWFRQLHGDVARSTREREERERLEQTNPRIVITMVHGTWARSATWVNPDSRFGWYLRHVLTPALVIPFRWSGRNSVKVRIVIVRNRKLSSQTRFLRPPPRRQLA